MSRKFSAWQKLISGEPCDSAPERWHGGDMARELVTPAASRCPCACHRQLEEIRAHAHMDLF